MPKKALPVLVVVALLLAANGAIVTLLPLRWSQAGLPAHTIAALAACVYAGSLLGALAGGNVIRRLGCQRSFIAFVIVFAAANAAFLLPGPEILFGLARIVAGSALSALYLLIESRLNAIATPELRRRLLSIYMIVFYLAQAFGSGVAGINPDIALAAAVVVILISGFGFGGFPSLPATPAASDLARSKTDLLAILRLSPEGYAIGLAAGVLLGCFYGLGPLFAKAVLIKPSLAGAFMSAAMIGGVLGLAAVGKISGHISTRTSMTFASLAAGTASLAIIAMTHSGPASLLITAGLFGAAAFCLYPLGSTSVNAASSVATRVAANALFILIAAIGGTVGPLFAEAMVSIIGQGAPFVVIAGATLGAGMFIAFLCRTCKNGSTQGLIETAGSPDR